MYRLCKIFKYHSEIHENNAEPRTSVNVPKPHNTWVQLRSVLEFRHIDTDNGIVQNYVCFLT